MPGRAEVGPSWSPTGDRLAYLTSDDGTVHPPVADADGANERPLPGTYSHINPSWSPDGTRIAALNDRGSSCASRSSIRTAWPRRSMIEGAMPAGSVVADRSSPTSWQRVAP